MSDGHGHGQASGGAALVDILPAGAGESHLHHGHVIVSQRTLLGVLTALLALTVLTVLATRAEVWISSAFHVALPIWITVTVALAIAVVKSVLVAMYFMQLRYDNPMNALALIFCLMALVSFLGFTMIDLGGRSTIDRYEGVYVTPGGTGGLTRGKEVISGPITTFAKVRAMELGTFDPSHDTHGQHPQPGSTAQRSRPITGITLEEFGGAPEEHDGDGTDHDAAGSAAPGH